MGVLEWVAVVVAVVALVIVLALGGLFFAAASCSDKAASTCACGSAVTAGAGAGFRDWSVSRRRRGMVPDLQLRRAAEVVVATL